MKLRRIAPAIGICLALVVAAPVASAEETDGSIASVTSDTASATETEPQPEPETSPSTTPPSSPEPSETPTPTPSEPATTPAPEPKPSSGATKKPKPAESPTKQPTKQPSTGGKAPAPHIEPEGLSADALASQLAQADTLLASLTVGNTKLAALLKELKTLTDTANAALERKADAEDRAKAATTRAESSRATAERLATELEEKQQLLREWAFSAYVDGGSTAEMVSVFDAMAKDPSKAGNPVGDLVYLTDDRVRVFEDIRKLTERQQVAADRAQFEARVAADAAKEAEEAEAEADAALKKHKEVIAKAEEEQAGLLVDAGPMAAMLVGLASPEAKARGEAILDALKERNIDLPDLGKPCSDDMGTYPNGQLPSSALCPLWMEPEHYARPNAAAAFAAMSQKFAKDMGRPLCVTSSYRSYAQQVDVKARRGKWAAVPGTSKHGLGLALDFCGGVNNFGTIEHLWMKQNAPMFGWFHPSWAGANGRLPEPWHWEFAG